MVRTERLCEKQMNQEQLDAMMVRLENLLTRGGFTIEQEKVVKEIGEMLEEAYLKGQEDGRIEGYQEGQADGEGDGYREGYDRGYEAGSDEGNY